jgi:hypothetical protein
MEGKRELNKDSKAFEKFLIKVSMSITLVLT